MNTPADPSGTWSRWEPSSFDPQPVAAPTPVPTVVEVSTPEVVLPTAEEIEQIYHQARTEGYKAGFEEGQSHAAAEVATQAAHLVNITQKFNESLREFDGVVAEEVLALALEISRQVVRSSVSFAPEAILTVVREALLQLPHQSAVILLNPEDVALVSEHMGEELKQEGHRIQEDRNIGRGDCLIDCGSAQVDATLESRWRRVVATLGSQLELEDKRAHTERS